MGEGWEEVVERGEGGGEESWRGFVRDLGFGREGGGGWVDFGGELFAGGAGSEGGCGEESCVERMSGREGSRASSSAGMSNRSDSATWGRGGGEEEG